MPLLDFAAPSRPPPFIRRSIPHQSYNGPNDKAQVDDGGQIKGGRRQEQADDKPEGAQGQRDRQPHNPDTPPINFEGDKRAPEQPRYYQRRYHKGRNLTPRITRRPKPLIEFNSRRVGGRVHAHVRLRAIFSPSLAMPQAGSETPTSIMPSDICSHRGQAGHDSLSRFDHTPLPPASAAPSISKGR